jgi:hypothetical protein
MTHQNDEEIRRRRATRALPGDESGGGGGRRGRGGRTGGRTGGRRGAVAVRCGPATAARERIEEGVGRESRAVPPAGRRYLTKQLKTGEMPPTVQRHSLQRCANQRPITV